MWIEMMAKIENHEDLILRDLRELSREREELRLLEEHVKIQKLIEFNNSLTYTAGKPFLYV